MEVPQYLCGNNFDFTHGKLLSNAVSRMKIPLEKEVFSKIHHLIIQFMGMCGSSLKLADVRRQLGKLDIGFKYKAGDTDKVRFNYVPWGFPNYAQTVFASPDKYSPCPSCHEA